MLRFEGRTRSQSFTSKEYGNGADRENGLLVPSKIGRLAVRGSRPMAGTPKTVTISHEANGWYVCFSCARVPAQPLPPTGQETGIDVGLRVFLITSEGDAVESPRHHRKAEKQLKKAQRRVSQRKKGSKRRREAVRPLKRKHQKVQRQRRDFHHKTALSLLRANDTIYLEDLRVANLVRNRHLAKSLSDAGWSSLRTILQRPSNRRGPSSCSRATRLYHTGLQRLRDTHSQESHVRTHGCASCRLILDRDENAARNIQWAGQRLWGLAGVPAGMNRESVGH